MINKRLQELRVKQNHTQKVMGELLNMTPEGYGHYESGKRKPSPEVIATLARFYNVSADYLLGNTDDPTPPGIKKTPPLNAEARVNHALEEIGLLKSGEELTVEEQLRVADFLIRNKDIILPNKNKGDQMDD